MYSDFFQILVAYRNQGFLNFNAPHMRNACSFEFYDTQTFTRPNFNQTVNLMFGQNAKYPPNQTRIKRGGKVMAITLCIAMLRFVKIGPPKKI